jgi:hypothetical protein
MSSHYKYPNGYQMPACMYEWHFTIPQLEHLNHTSLTRGHLEKIILCWIPFFIAKLTYAAVWCDILYDVYSVSAGVKESMIR